MILDGAWQLASGVVRISLLQEFESCIETVKFCFLIVVDARDNIFLFQLVHR